MAIRYHYDLYPRTDPRDGVRTRRFTKLQRAIYRDVIGVGSGAADIRSTDAEAADLDPRGEQYIRVVREDTVAETELVVGGWWVNRYNHDTAVARQTKRLTFAGAGTMAYLARARMWSHTYMWELDNDFVPQDPFDDVWRLWNQGNWAGGDYLGAVLWRVIQEALHYRTGSTYTHRHKDGETYTDAHDDDRTATQGSSIEFVTLGFDQYEDSDGTPWTWPSGEFQASVGENLLSVVQRIMQAGLYVEMDPDTFELRAWQGRPASKLGRSTDRTGGAWATGVVRFQAPTDGTVATGNMLNDSEREINSHLPRHIILAGGQDTYARAIAAIGNGIRWEGFESSTATDVDALEQIAATQITAREEAADAGSIRMKLGTSQVSGKYRPWEEVRLDDLVTVHTGTGEWDYDEATYPVAGLKIELKKSGAWWAWAELGASFGGGSERKFEVAPVAAHTHPPNPQLCRPGTPGTSSSTRLYFSTDTAGFSVNPDSSWVDAVSKTVRLLKTAPDGTYPATGTGSTWDAVNAATDEYIGTASLYAVQLTDAAMLAAVQAGGLEFHSQMRWRSRYGIGISEAAQDNYFRVVARVYRLSTTTFIGTAISNAVGATPFIAQSTHVNRTLTDTFAAVPGAALNDWLIFEVGTRHVAPTSGGTGSAVLLTSNGVADLPEDESSTSGLNAWIQFSTSGVGATAGDLPHDTVHQDAESVGTSVRAARCDHEHAHGYLSADGAHYHDFEQITGTDPASMELPWVNVLDYDADPTGVEDSWQAFEDALETRTERSAAIIVPPGVYRMSAPLVLGNSTVIFGIGANMEEQDPGGGGALLTYQPHSVLYFDNDTDGIIAPDDAGVTYRCHHPVIENITIRGGGAAQGNRGVWLRDNASSAVSIQRVGLAEIRNCFVEYWTTAIDFDGTADSCKVIGGHIHDCAAGFVGGLSEDVFDRVCVWNLTTGPAVSISGDRGQVIGCEIEPVVGSGIVLTSAAEYNRVVANDVKDITGTAIDVAGNNNVIVANTGSRSISDYYNDTGTGNEWGHNTPTASFPTTGGSLDPDDVRDAGRWEVVVDGSPPEALYDGDDWLYHWVT